MSERKQQTRQKLIEAASRGFRLHGFDGVGVDGLASEAGVTSGAFYGHFKSKTEALRVTIEAGLDEVAQGVHAWRESHGEAWLGPFVEWYLSEQRCTDIAGGCVLPGLSAEVARADDEVKAAYEAGVRRAVEAVAAGMTLATPPERRRAAWSILTSISGGVVLARSIRDRAMSREIADAVRDSIIASFGGAKGA